MHRKQVLTLCESI
uniref:Uncharacterized protein n=1 Tax=Anguilla anguilla TaxID=7936 RepID=A0A0E9RZ84_ANGAN